MNQTIRPATERAATPAWRLWVDRCGGFELLIGDRFTIGGSRGERPSQVQVRADWRRCEGTLVRRDGDYFWTPVVDDVRRGGRVGERLMRPGDVFPIEGSATLSLSKPSPLSGSAVLSLAPPHRFEHHVDRVILVEQTIWVGPSSSDHIRCSSMDASAVIVIRDGIWRAKLKGHSLGNGDAKQGGHPLVNLEPGQRVSLGDIDMMLERA